MSIAYGVSDSDSARSPRKSVLLDPNGSVAVAYDEVKPADHPDQVLSDLAKFG